MNGIEGAMVFAFVMTAIISAVLGWAIIEGLIWVFSHISFAWK